MLIEPQSIIACTISRDIQEFDLLIEDMQATVGDRWGDVGLAEAVAFLAQPDSDQLAFVALALDSADEADLDRLIPIIAAAKARDIRVILVAEGVSPTALHQLLREGADDAELARRWVVAMRGKAAGHGIDDPSFLQPDRPMSAIGG